MKRGSVLIMALWIISVLAVMALSFAFEAHQQAGINVYIRERNRVNRLIEPGRILGEVVMLGYSEAKEPEIKNGEPDWEEIFEEEDRWCKEKYALKNQTRCTIGPIRLDERSEEEGGDASTVTVEIELANSGSENGININELYSGGDKNYALRWQMILQNAGIDEELEVEVPDPDGRGSQKHNLMNLLIASWNDWRDEDDDVSRGPLTDSESNPRDDDGAESKWYEEADEAAEKEARSKEERNALAEDKRRPRNGSIPDIKELGYVRGFKDFPSILTGGSLYDGTKWEEDHKKEKDTEDNPTLKGIASIFGTSGSSKIVINPQTTVDQLMTIPGIFQEGGSSSRRDEDREDSMELAQAILDGLRQEPEDADDRIAASDDAGQWWPYKDWQDLNQRLEDSYNGDIQLGEDAQQYIDWNPSETSVFKMKITGESMGMKRVVNCKCYVKDKKVRYMEWRED